MKAKVLITFLIVLVNTFAGIEKREITGTVIQNKVVKARAVITANNLVISGLNGEDIVLNFGEIPKNSIEGKGAEVGFKVEYLGEKSLDKDNILTVTLNNKMIEMSCENSAIKTKLPAVLSISDIQGNQYQERGDQIVGENIQITQIADSKEIYRGKITGIINKEDINNADVGKYNGQTTLTVTLSR